MPPPPPPQTNPSTIPGITYSQPFIDSLARCPPALAGVFTLATTKDLWALVLSDPATKPILDAWAEERRNIDSRKLFARHARIMRLVEDQAFHGILCSSTHPAFSLAQTSSTGGKGTGGNDNGNGNDNVGANLPLLTAIWYIARLVKAKPVLFPRSQVSDAGLSFDTYDMLHGWKLLKWVWRVKSQGTPVKDPKAVLAVRPVYHVESAAVDEDGGKRGSESVEGTLGQQVQTGVQGADGGPASQGGGGQDIVQDGNDGTTIQQDSNEDGGSKGAEDATETSTPVAVLDAEAESVQAPKREREDEEGEAEGEAGVKKIKACDSCS
ncbi:hypothetical protein BDW62DRAFT_203181 [Aspergillus aurantiobrunneus]